jgi:hypothetical protein
MHGCRTAEGAEQFMADSAARPIGLIQLTADGTAGYPGAVEKAFGANVDCAILNKSYEGGTPPVQAKRRYSPAVCVGANKNVVAVHLNCAMSELRMLSALT